MTITTFYINNKKFWVTGVMGSLHMTTQTGVLTDNAEFKSIFPPLRDLIPVDKTKYTRMATQQMDFTDVIFSPYEVNTSYVLMTVNALKVLH